MGAVQGIMGNRCCTHDTTTKREELVDISRENVGFAKSLPGPDSAAKSNLKDLLNSSDDDDNASATLERAPKFVGSFGKLHGFLRRCLASESITDSQYKDLVAALDEVSDHGKQKDDILRHKTLKDMPLFKGSSEKEMEEGMGLMDYTAPKPALKRRPSCNEGSFIMDDQEVHEVAELLRNPGFNCRTRGTNVMADVQVITFGFTSPYNLVGRYAINTATLDRWVAAIAGLYKANPYHNWKHAFDVFQFLHISLASGGSGEYFNFQDILAIMCGAIGHDVAHCGTNNAFLVNTGAKLAITYNDRAPLENMHASVCFELLSENNFLVQLKHDDFKKTRTKIIDNILATDMGHHFELADKFNTRVSHQTDTPFKKNTKEDRQLQKESKEDRHLLMQAFTHMADLSHCARPWDVHKILVTCLEEEFFSQGDQEKAAGLPISPMMDRSKDSAATGQTFFLDKLVRPMLEPFCTFLSSSLQDTFKANLTNNRDKWADLVKKHGKLPAKDLLPLE